MHKMGKASAIAVLTEGASMLTIIRSVDSNAKRTVVRVIPARHTDPSEIWTEDVLPVTPRPYRTRRRAGSRHPELLTEGG